MAVRAVRINMSLLGFEPTDSKDSTLTTRLQQLFEVTTKIKEQILYASVSERLLHLVILGSPFHQVKASYSPPGGFFLDRSASSWTSSPQGAVIATSTLRSCIRPLSTLATMWSGLRRGC